MRHLKDVAFLASIVCSFMVSACATGGYDASLRIQNDDDSANVLIGTFNGSIALIHGNPKNATLEVSDGSLTCFGLSDSGEFNTDMSRNRVRHTFKIDCDDGRTGNLVATINARPQGYGASLNGVGVGTLNDGSELRAIFGEMSGTLAW